MPNVLTERSWETGKAWQYDEVASRAEVAQLVERKRGQVPKTKWPEGCFAFLVPDPFSAAPSA
ncbi:hypothetical protein CKO51_04850 [Rhodopirellula sp. SM50]|nr:hypothetical protein CKO51_04850 [Rhodopirellula sp. SM50]